MTEVMFSDRPAKGRSFQIAMWVIGSIAFVLFAATIYGVWRREPLSAKPLATSPVPPPAMSSNHGEQAFVPPLDPPSTEVRVNVEEEANGASGPSEGAASPGSTTVHVTPGSLMQPEPALAELAPIDPPSTPFLGPASETGEMGAVAGGVVEENPTELFAALSSAAATQPLSDLIVERLMVAGAELRAKGNTQGAMKNFREVESAFPDHPRVLSEIAATLGKMGLKEKSEAYWQQVESLGEFGAGSYYPLARQQLHGEVIEKKAPETTMEAPDTPVKREVEKVMNIAKVDVEEKAPTSEGQQVSLRVVIAADPASMPVADDLFIRVDFYDRTSSGEIKNSTADTSFLYPTEPYDWQVDGTETVIINYLQPVFTEEQMRDLGERTYYGYVIELYYRDDLQDKIAVPEDLADRRPEPPPLSEDVPMSTGPENALFPSTVFP